MKKGFLFGFGVFLAGVAVAVNVDTIPTKSDGDLGTSAEFNLIVDTLRTIENNAGNIGIGEPNPSMKLDVNGNARIQGDITANAFLYSSDRSLKQNIKTAPGLEVVMDLEGVVFEWQDNGGQSMGLVAQDVELVLPHLVKTSGGTGYKAVNYGGVIASLVEAVKQQQTQIEALQAQLDGGLQ